MTRAPLDKQYMRVCAVYRLLSRGHIDARRARELLQMDPHTQGLKSIASTVDIWARELSRKGMYT